MKYNFDNSRFARLWTESAYLRKFIIDLFPTLNNDAWWKTRYVKAANPTMKNADGTRLYSVSSMTKPATSLMDMRTDYSESIQGDGADAKSYTGSIPGFSAESIEEDAFQREYKQKYFEQFGDDGEFLNQLLGTLQSRIASAHSTLSNMGAQLASTGKISVDFGRGVKMANIAEAPIPAENFKKAGAKVWTDTTALLLDQMAKIEQDWRMANGYDGALAWHISRNMFYNNVMKNAQVKDWVKQFRQLNDKPYVDGLISEQLFSEAMGEFPNLSPIYIENESQQSKTIEGAVTKKQGWKDTNVVLCPAGNFGEIVYSNLAEESLFSAFGANGVGKVFAPMEGGIFSVVNTTRNKGDYKVFTTEVLMNAIPTLTNFPYHVIVDTAATE